MIAKNLLLFILIIVLPTIYFFVRGRRKGMPKGNSSGLGLPFFVMVFIDLVMIVIGVILAQEQNFIPEDPTLLYIFLLMLALYAIPKFVYVLCSMTGMAISRMVGKKHHNYGNLVGLLLVPILWFVSLYGAFIGFEKTEVNSIELRFADLPKAFDGYRIALFSDTHIGTYKGSLKPILQQVIDSIKAQQADMIIFAGDLQNVSPQDIYPHQDVLSQLKAPDGVFAILGNHDYAEYFGGDEIAKVANCRETVSLIRQQGWQLLLNEHRVVSKGQDSLIIAGMENDGDGVRFPQKGDVKKTLDGVKPGDFIIMLEHDPSSWRRKIVPDGRSQLTLSGHTHAMQFKLGDWSPMALKGTEWNGLYKEGKQQLFITAGVGGVVPWRFGATGEVVVITLRKGQ